MYTADVDNRQYSDINKIRKVRLLDKHQSLKQDRQSSPSSAFTIMFSISHLCA